MSESRGSRRAGGKETGNRENTSSARSHPYSRDNDRNFGRVDEKVENKLYVGNLDHRVTEYHVIKLFKPFGKIRREEFLWHTHGPRRGEPRGYAFVEYATRKEAELAREKMNGQIAFNRPLIVRFVDEKITTHNSDVPMYGKDEFHLSDSRSAKSQPSSSDLTSHSRSSKIAAIKNKLRTIAKDEPKQSHNISAGNYEASVGNRFAEARSGPGGGFRLGEIAEKGNEVQTKTLLQTGQRWSSWG